MMNRTTKIYPEADENRSLQAGFADMHEFGVERNNAGSRTALQDLIFNCDDIDEASFEGFFGSFDDCSSHPFMSIKDLLSERDSKFF